MITVVVVTAILGVAVTTVIVAVVLLILAARPERQVERTYRKAALEAENAETRAIIRARDTLR